MSFVYWRIIFISRCSAAFVIVLWQLMWIAFPSNSVFRKSASLGKMRGIDYYASCELICAMATALMYYRLKFGRYPNIVRPVGFNEKIMWYKFFGEIKVPESGDKLSTNLLLTEELKKQVLTLPVVWSSEVPRLPSNTDIEPGTYYLKASHGSGMFERIQYPLSDSRRTELERIGSSWLKNRFGWSDGEWWYSTFKPKLLMEQSVTGDENSISWNFYVVNGKVPMIGLFMKSTDGHECSTWLDERFCALPWKSKLPDVSDYKIGSQQNLMLEISKKIGEKFAAIRVDFLLGTDGRIYLCELTFSPGNAMTYRPPEVDALLTKHWLNLY